LFIKFELFSKIIYCSNHGSSPVGATTGETNRVESSPGPVEQGAAALKQEDELLNQQSNSNEQSVNIRVVSNNFDSVEEGIRSASSSTAKINSNIQSNVNKQLQPTTIINDEINFKNKQQNINVQVLSGNKNLDRQFTYTSPPQYNARSFNSQNPLDK